MVRPIREDYESTGQWFIACILADSIEDRGLTVPLPTQQEISDAIDRAASGTSLGEYLGFAWDAAAEIAYDEFPAFREEDT